MGYIPEHQNYVDNPNLLPKEQKQEKFVNKALGFAKAILKSSNDGTMELNVEGESKFIEMRNTAPRREVHKWVPINIKQEGSESVRKIWLNINNLAKVTGLTKDSIKNQRLEQLINKYKNQYEQLEIFKTNLSEATKTNTIVQHTEKPQYSKDIDIDEFLTAEPNYEDVAKGANEEMAQNATVVRPQKVTLTGEQLKTARNWLDDPRNKIDLELGLLEAQTHGNAYCVIKKEVSGLPFNIEYHGTGVAFLRYESNFSRGSFKQVSKMVHLYTGQLIAKTKIITTDSFTADAYHRSLKKGSYPTRPMEKQGALAEANASNDLKGVLQNIITTINTKVSPKNPAFSVTKVVSYFPLQRGTIQPTHFTDQEKKQVARSLVNNLADFHKQGLCHNDLKDENFLWNRIKNNVVTKIIDLGFMTPLNSLTKYTSGTGYFMPPELIDIVYANNIFRFPPSGQAELYNKAKDAFALGTTLLKLYGINPQWIAYLDQASNGAIRWSEAIEKMKSPNSFPANVPPDIQEVIRGLLKPDPLTRMTPEEAQKILETL